jgi:hypothetical protein
VHERKVVDLAHAGHGQRRGVGPLAHARIVERLDVHDHVASRQRALDRLLDGVGRGVSLADRVRGRDADHDVGELTAGCLAHA